MPLLWFLQGKKDYRGGRGLRIALDAMGGDFAPKEIIKGAIEASKRCGCEIILVGDREIIQRELEDLGGGKGLPLFMRDASEVIGMSEHPSIALRRKRNSSIRRAMELVREGKAKAVVSAGNTGAVMVAAKLMLGTLQDVDRPGIAVTLPGRKEPFLLIDAGANVGSRPENILEFAIMGHLYAEHMMGRENPKIGLLSIGEEEIKGDGLMRNSFQLLRNVAQINFIGNVEAKEIFNNHADVVVCDGLMGNITLKVGEAAAALISHYLKREFSKGLRGKLSYLLLKPGLTWIKKRTDYKEHGGAPLLGVNGICIICHGSSNAYAIANAIKVACDFAEKRLNQKIEVNLGAIKEDLSIGRRFWSTFRDLKDAFRLRGERGEEMKREGETEDEIEPIGRGA